MKISYCLLNFPFKYHLSYLNDNLYYKTPNHKTITLFGTLINHTSKTLRDTKLPILVGNGGKGGFDYTLEVANVFDNVVTNNANATFTQDQLIHTYHNQVLQNADFCLYWSCEINETPNIKNDDGLYKSDAFHKICNTFFNHVASTKRPAVAGDCLLHYMCSGKKKPITM